MTDQRTKREIDFFSLDVAPEEETKKQTAHVDMAKPGASYSVQYIVPTVDIENYPISLLEEARKEVMRRVYRGIEEMERYIFRNNLDARPVVYSKPDLENFGSISYQIGVEPIPADTKRVEPFRAIVGQVFGSDPELVRHIMAMCTPGRDPLTGHGVE